MARVEIDEIVLRQLGSQLLAAPHASVQVNISGGGAATVYAAASGGTTLTNPLTADAVGRIEGYVDPGTYDLVVASSASIIGYTQKFEAVSAVDAGDGPLSLIEAKGDLLVGAAASDADRFLVGDDGEVFVPDSTSPLGLTWKARQVIDASLPPYNGAFDASTDDWAAIQAAADDAILQKKGLLLPGRAALSDTLLLKHPTNGTRFALDIFAPAGEYNQFTWTGGDNKAIIRTVGMMRCNAYGLRIRIPDGTTGVIGIDCDVQHTAPTMNSSIINWIGIHVLGDLPTNAIAWRLAHASGGEDMSVHQWLGCSVTFGGSQSSASSVTGFQVLGGNTLGLSWYGGGVSGCGTAYTTLSSDSAQDGSYSLFFQNCNNSGNQTDFKFARPGGYKIDGGRFEVGNRFLDCESSGSLTSTTRSPVKVTVRNAQIVSYRPSDGILFRAYGAANLTIEDNLIQTVGASDVPYDEDMVQVSTFSGSFGVLSIQRNLITANAGSTTGGAPQKLYTLGTGTWTVIQDQNQKIDVTGASAGAVTGMLDRILPSPVKVIAMGNLGSSATLNCAGAPEIYVTGTLTANCTLTLSNMQAGQSVTFALTQDATGSRTITFSPTAAMPGGAIALSTAAGTLDIVTTWSPTGSNLRAALVGKAFA